jgi:hypothetical protein
MANNNAPSSYNDAALQSDLLCRQWMRAHIHTTHFLETGREQRSGQLQSSACHWLEHWPNAGLRQCNQLSLFPRNEQNKHMSELQCA